MSQHITSLQLTLPKLWANPVVCIDVRNDEIGFEMNYGSKGGPKKKR